MNQNIVFGVSTWLWQSPFTAKSISLFPKIKKMGFDVVEIPLEDPSLIDAEKVKQALKNNGLKPSICVVFGDDKDLTGDDPSLYENCFEHAKACFEISKTLEASFVAGPLYAAVGKARLASEEQRQVEWERSVKNLRTLAKIARSYDLDIALEPLNRFESDLINTAEQVMRLIDDIDEECMKVALDGFHMTIEEQDMVKAIQTVGDKLIHVQVSENHRGVPGTGLTPWADFAKGLAAIDYKGAIVMESFTPENKQLAAAVNIWRKLAPSQDEFAQKGLEFLKKTFND
ncbi:sugar phosphate isomerase/epimerase family protein [Maribacter sp. X9]|uniref:sugar phosphate isomerase/epimerase family protein n=1 Tax=Maribacter sp. X9 TaxID=3402159 RepID=UPI003AF3D978